MKKFQEMHIPCTEQEYLEVKSLLERMGCREYSDSGVRGCQRVFVYDDGDFQSLNHYDDKGFPTFTLQELRQMVTQVSPEKQSTKFEKMWIPCNEEQYPEVKYLLESMGYTLVGHDFLEGVGGYSGVDTDTKGNFIALGTNVVNAPTVTLDDLRWKALPKVIDEQKSDATMSLEDRIKRIEIHLGLVSPDKPEEVELKDWCVSLTHETLSKDEVVSRCFAAALSKGYERTKNEVFLTLWKHALNFGEGNARMFSTSLPLSECCGIVHASGHEEITLEEFEAYCGVNV